MKDSKIKVQWDLLRLKCRDCGAFLEIKDGQWGCFYGCVSYPKCYNRMNVEMYEKILDKITSLLAEHNQTNLTGYKWSYRAGYQHYEFVVEKELPGQYIISVLNVKKRKVIY